MGQLKVVFFELVLRYTEAVCTYHLQASAPKEQTMNVSTHWRMKAQRYNMNNAGVATLPETQTEQESFDFKGNGELYSYTTVYDAPAGFDQYAPYIVGLIKTEEGPLVTAQITDVDEEDLTIGMPVEMVTRKLRTEGAEGVIVYGYKFRPTL